MVRRAYAPGVHGITQAGRTKLTGFGIQLREKQKAKRAYGLLERQFRNYVDKASSSKGNTAELLQQMLEMRLDNVVYRLGVAESRAAARQIVAHGHVLINGKKLDIPSYEVCVNDAISFTPNVIEALKKRKEVLAKQEKPSWLSFDLKTTNGKVISRPGLTDLERLFEITPIIEYYSR